MKKKCAYREATAMKRRLANHNTVQDKFQHIMLESAAS